MIGVFQHDGCSPAGVRARHAHCQLIRFARRVDQPHDVERLRQRGSQPFRELAEQPAHVTRVRVEQRHLPGAGFHDGRMTVPDMRHIVVRIEQAPAGTVVQVLHPAAHGMKRITVGQAQVGPDVGGTHRFRRPSASRESVAGGRRVTDRSRDQTQNEIGVGTQCLPDLAFAGGTYPRKVGSHAEQIDNHLEVEVRRPPAIHGSVADRADAFASPDCATLKQSDQR
jgi:hypothetical protein